MALKKEKLSIALFGFGRMGQIHFKTLVQNQYRLNLTYIVDEFPEPVQAELDFWGLKDTKIMKTEETEEVLSDSR